jgi:hypothetical protein
MVIEVLVLETDQVDDFTSTLENICRNEKLVSEHSERKTEENNEDEGEMETERDTTEQEESLLDNDKQPWLSVIVLPLMIKKQGRPKGLTQTVIGLPKKRMRSSKCAPFQKKSSIEIECLILEWFVGKDYTTKAIKDNFIISEELVEQRPELVSSSCLDSLVNIEITRKRCTTEAWKAIEMVYGEKRRNPIYICETCTLDADTKEASVMCSSCLEWQHLSCARLKLFPKAKHWFCNKCKN